MATVKELKVRAAELKIVGRSTMTKDELVSMIAQAEGRNVPPPPEYQFAVTVGDGRRSYEERATEALESVVAITMDTLAGDSPFPHQRQREVPPEVLKRRSRHTRARARLRKLKRGH